MSEILNETIKIYFFSYFVIRNATVELQPKASMLIDCASFTDISDDEGAQNLAPVLMNGSPKTPRIQVPSVLDHNMMDITLHRKDNEGFGFVILTSKSKPPPGGK